MPRSYSQFTYDDLSALNLKVRERQLFNHIENVEPSNTLKDLLEKNLKRNLRTEKAKSELIISPVLNELEDRNGNLFGYYSGYNFDVDKKLGLKGFCDFILSFEPDSPIIEAPAFCVVEAKNDNLDIGVPQCVAEMYAAQIFNQKRGVESDFIYGAITFGYEWKFLRLEKQVAYLDTNIYYLVRLPELLGVLQEVVNQSKEVLMTITH
jgi:hypothetical protein